MTTYIDVEADVSIAVEQWPGSVPGAPVLLALHGFSSNGVIFGGLAKAFDGEVELIAIDCRGRGRSSHPEDPSRFGMRRHADDAAAVLTQLGKGDVIVVGTSMGAWIATQLAAHHPELVKALVLVDGGYLTPLAPGTDPVAHVNGILLGAIDRMDIELPSAELVIAAAKASPQLGSVWDDAVEASVAAGLEQTANGVRSKMRAFAAAADAVSYFDPMDRPYLVADLEKVSCPAYLVTAPDGFPIDATRVSPPVMLPEAIDAIRKALPQLTHEEAPGLHHFTICAGPESNALITKAVRSFV